jgi:4-aminobutyrate aminotransferase-like enzyme
MGNGYPVAAVITRREIVEGFAFAGSVFSTFGGNPVAAQAGLAVLDVIRDERIIPHVKRVGEVLLRRLGELQTRSDEIVAVRGLGLLLGVQLGDPARAKQVVDAMRGRGVLIGRTGPRDDVLKIRPPLVFDEEQADLLVAALEASLFSD